MKLQDVDIEPVTHDEYIKVMGPFLGPCKMVREDDGSVTAAFGWQPSRTAEDIINATNAMMKHLGVGAG